MVPLDSDSSSAIEETDSNGKARFNVKINDDTETGEYEIDVRVSKKGYDTNTVTISFDVGGGDGDDRDTDRNGNGSSVIVLAASESGSCYFCLQRPTGLVPVLFPAVAVEDIQAKTPKELVREYETKEGDKAKEYGPFVYGYSMTVGPDGRPKPHDELNYSKCLGIVVL